MRYRYLFVLAILLLCVGCGLDKKEKILLTCEVSLDSEIVSLKKENISITFYGDNDNYSNRTTRLVTGIIDGEVEDINPIMDRLKSNYCNNQIKENYSCEVIPNNDTILIEEEGLPNDILGIHDNIKINEYQKILEDKGFKCKKESNK